MLPPVAAVVAPVVAPVEPVVEQVVQPVVQPVVPPVVAPVAPPVSNWASEWEAIASTPAAGSAPSPLHTAAVSALDAVFGAAAAPATWGAAPLDPRTVAPVLAVPSSPLSALDRPLGAISEEVATPLALEAARALPPAQPSAQPIAVVVPKPLPPRSTPPSMPPPPSTPPPPRLVQVPAPAQQLVERAIRTAPAAPVQRRSTVRLGFTDASVIDLRPEDPIAKALHTVAQALMERDHA